MSMTYMAEQSSREEKEYCINWTRRLPTGVTVTSITATHTPPSGSAVTPTNDYSLAPVTYTYMPAGLIKGDHTLSVIATTSNANISPEVVFVIKVNS